MNKQDNTVNSLAHTKWNCKYHIVLHRSTEEKYFMRKKEQKYVKYYGTTRLTEGAVGMGVKAGDTYKPNESDRLSITTN